MSKKTPADTQRALLAERLDALLPQTQCTRCGYPDCASYAQAIAAGSVGIDQCPPGGALGIERLARATGLPVVLLDPRHGTEQPRAVAFVDEAACIGCTLCLDACPTDAIVGAPKWMHSVIESRCTGCELCLPACPVDCIVLEPVDTEQTGWAAWSQPQADQAREHYRQHVARRMAIGSQPEPAAQRQPIAAGADEKKRAVMEAALRRARERRHGSAA